MSTTDQRTRFLSAAFNISPAEWESVHNYQSGVCFVWGRPQIGKRLSTYHSHEDGFVSRAAMFEVQSHSSGKLENAFKAGTDCIKFLASPSS